LTSGNEAIAGGISRRDILKALGGAGLLAAAGYSASDAAIAAPAESMVPHVKLGKTGMSVSRLALGGSWDIDQEVLALAFARGINYIDTAEDYRSGNSERWCGQFLKSIGAVGHSPVRKKIWLVTKSYFHRELDKHLPGSLERLGQDYVDCLYMHRVQDVRVVTDPGIKATAAALKASGKTRFFGFSVHDQPVVECLNAAADMDHIDVIMFRYDCHYYPRTDLMAAIDRCAKKGIGLIAMKTQVGAMTMPDKIDPFKQRGLNQHQAAIRAVAADSRVHSVCSEMTTTEMITQNSDAFASKITTAELDAIREHARMVSHLWCRGCDSICRTASGCGKNIAVADILRFLMYHDHYGKTEQARELFAALPPSARDMNLASAADWKAAQKACPHNVPLVHLLDRAKERLA
jgi:uncharacterized protein